MTEKSCCTMNRIRCFFYDRRGSSLPMVMLIALVVIIIGGAVAYSTIQLFSIIRGETHNQYTYIAAESAIERSFCNLDATITKPSFAANRSIVYTNKDSFAGEIITCLNSVLATDVIKKSFDVGVYGNSAIDKANVALSFSINGTVSDNGNTVTIPLKVTSTAQMETGLFKAYGKKVVATRSFNVYKPFDFELKGAVYTLGDLVARGNEKSVIKGDVYTFGTGLDELKRMQQYYNGGICAVDSATLHIHDGSAYTASLVRAGIFNEPVSGSHSSTIIVDEDVVAQGIQVFGNDDAVVVLRDAYTFDDIEMNGANSIIAINRNYFGLNYGDDTRHDTSSGILNVAPLYGNGFQNQYMKSRIVINKHVLINGTSFRITDPLTGQASHKIENVGYAFESPFTFPIYPIYVNAPETYTHEEYETYLRLRKANAKGFSVLINANWGSSEPEIAKANDPLQVLPEDKEQFLVQEANNWVSAIRASIGSDYASNSLTFNDITGYCSFAMAANDRLYTVNLLNESASDNDIKRIPSPASDDSIKCGLIGDVKGITDANFWDNYRPASWLAYTSASASDSGIPTGLNELMSKLKSHVSILASKTYKDYDLSDPNNDVISYSLTYGPDGPLMSGIGTYLDSEISAANQYVLRYNNSMNPDVITELRNKYDDPANGVSYTDFFVLVLNLDPSIDLVINADMKGIVFTLGKLTIESSDSTETTLTGAVLAAGRGYNPSNPKILQGSAAHEIAGESKLPRVNYTPNNGDANNNCELFNNWGYAALELRGANIQFPGRDELLDEFFNQDPTGDGLDMFEVLDAVF